MPLTRQVFDSSENISTVINEVLNLVKSIDTKVNTMRTEQECLKNQLTHHEQQLSELVNYVVCMDVKLDSIVANCGALKTQVQEATRSLERPKETVRVIGEREKLNNPEIIKLVKTYISNRNWNTLESGLKSALDQDNVQYKQLHDSKSLWDIFCKGYIQLASTLLDAGLPVDTSVQDGSTMLSGAVKGGHLQLVKLLLDKGANVNEIYSQEYTPLMRAAERGHLDVVKFLVKAGANTAAKDTGGRTALKWAEFMNHAAIVRHLKLFPH